MNLLKKVLGFVKQLNINYQTKVIIIAFIPAIICLFVQSTMSYKFSTDLIRGEILKANERMMDETNSNIYRYFSDLQKKLISIYYYKDQMYMLENLAKTNNNDISTMNDFIRNYYLQRFEADDNILGMYIYSNEGKLFVSYNPISNYEGDIINIDTKETNKNLINFLKDPNGHMLVNFIYSKKLNKMILRLGIQLTQSITNERIGGLFIDIEEANFDKIINQYSIYKNQTIKLLTADNMLLYSNEVGMSKTEKGINSIIDNNTNAILKKNDSIILERVVNKYSFKLINSFQIKAIEENLTKTTNTMLKITVFLGIIIIFVSYLLALTVTIPIRNISRAMRAVENGNIYTRVKLGNNDEVGQLARSFNSMIERIETLINSENKQVILKNEAKLKALQAQVNPHFLYNTLQVMESIARIEKIDKVGDMCNALSDIFRYSINMSDKISTIYAEIEHLKNYLYIQNIRFPGELIVNILCENEIYNFSIPRLIIQPLVENSIKHGLTNKTGTKLIKLKIYLRVNSVIILVIDNGVGIKTEKLQYLNSQLHSEDLNTFDNCDSIGLMNVTERMRILFGNKFCINIYSKENKGTIIKMSIPVKAKLP